MRSLRSKASATRKLVAALILALLSLYVSVSRAKGQDNPASAQTYFSSRESSSTQSASILNSDFTIADFDGDEHPDVAVVEMEKGAASGDARYSIRFKLTSGEPQVFGVTAPAGGLHLVARDVNGDNTLDVLVSSTWQHTQIAVFLNDGHGNFTLADPRSFPAMARDDAEQLGSGRIFFSDSGVLVRPENSAGDCEETRSNESAWREVGRFSIEARSVAVRLPLLAILGRAPPFSFFPA